MSFFKDIFVHFFNSNTFQKGAALAYYAVFSILPMIVVVTSLLGIFFGEQAVSGEIFEQLKGILGESAAVQIQDIIKNQHTNHNGLLTSLIGFATLALSASGMFNQLHSSFNNIWSIKAKPKSSILRYFTKHIASFTILIVLFFILLVSTMLHAVVGKIGWFVEHEYSFVLEHLLSFLLTSIVFGIMYKYLGDAVVYWKSIVVGALLTSLLFHFGKIGIGMYIGRSHISTMFGSASVLALLMIWVYYTSQIIFLGASFVDVYSKKLAHDIKTRS